MGESRKDALRVNFDRKLKLEFHGVKVTSDTGLLAFNQRDLYLNDYRFYSRAAASSLSIDAWA